jgi:FKBP-type peptidyl-prolyl cis-trans isomerase
MHSFASKAKHWLPSLMHVCFNCVRKSTDGKTFFQVIQGYEQGVPGMCKGETRTLTVPAHLAYGDRGVPQAGIPGGATLHFTVELVQIL